MGLEMEEFAEVVVDRVVIVGECLVMEEVRLV